MAEPPIQLADLDRPPTAAWREPRPRSSRSSAESHLELEALELHEIQTREDDELDYSTASASSGDDAPRRTIRRTISRPSDRPSRQGLWGQLTRFWGRHVTLTVPQKTNRDHYALERTFLAYIRTSVVIAMQGVLIAQLFRLQQIHGIQGGLRFHEVGIPLSAACHCVAAFVALIGAYRFWRQQNAIARGKFFAGGWEMNMVGIFLCAVIMTTFALSVAIIIEINKAPPAFVKRILRR